LELRKFVVNLWLDVSFDQLKDMENVFKVVVMIGKDSVFLLKLLSQLVKRKFGFDSTGIATCI